MRTNTSLVRDGLLPRFVFLPYWVMRLVLAPFVLFRRRRKEQGDGVSTTLCIEAGVPGWKSIEFKEIYSSACEYLGADRVIKLEIDKNESYLRQVRTAFDQVRPSHYVYDPRTGSPKWHVGLAQAMRISLMCQLRGIVPVALLTDFSDRYFRALSAIVTANRGVVITFLSAKAGSPIFPHRRLVGPCLMPLSKASLASLDTLRDTQPALSSRKASFVGALYEPRTAVLRSIEEQLRVRGFTLDIRGRVFGAPRMPDEEYWSILCHSAVVVTTSEQIELPILDWKWIKQLTYRYVEATAAGTLLVAPEVPGVRRYFVPGEHFVSFASPADAAEVIEYYLTNESERARIAEQGRRRAHALVHANSFWVGVDIGLGKDSLT